MISDQPRRLSYVADRKMSTAMRRRIFRPLAAIVSVLLLASTPTHADPVVVSDVIRIISGYQNSPNLELRTFSLVRSPESVASSSLLSGVSVRSDEPQSEVHTVPQADVEAAICDCGAILLAGGGFPKWPLLFLAAIPVFFIPGHENTDIPISPPPPPVGVTPFGVVPPPQTPVPEPASLLLFGSALAAFGGVLRRRYAAMKLSARVDATKKDSSK